MSSGWVKSFITLKKTTAIIQNIGITPYLVSHSHLEMLNTKVTSQLQSLGIAKYALNSLKVLKKQPLNATFLKKSKTLNYSQFNNLENVNKLNTLGFTFSNVKLVNNNYHVTVFKSLSSLCVYPNLLLSSNPLLTSLSSTSSLKALHTYLVLFYTN